MKYAPNAHRRSIRLPHYDYSHPAAYFVTICIHDRKPRFGNVTRGTIQLNDAGRMVARWWEELNRKFLMVRTEAFIVMPNHIHGILQIMDAESHDDPPSGVADLRVRPNLDDPKVGAHTGAPLKLCNGSRP